MNLNSERMSHPELEKEQMSHPELEKEVDGDDDGKIRDSVGGDRPQNDRLVQLMLSDYYGISEDDGDSDEEGVEGEERMSSVSSRSQSQGNLSMQGSKVVLGKDGRPLTGLKLYARKKQMDLDSSEFEIEQFMNKVLKEKNLKELLDIDDELGASVRSLDSDLQTLVYDNYNKFISATDTIREMRTKVEDMDGEIKNLVGDMEALRLTSTQLKEILQPNRKRIGKLTAVKQLLTNLNFLFNLPQRLKKAIGAGSYSQAVKDYQLSNVYLIRHSYIKSFERIQLETTTIMKGLQNTMRKIVKDSTSQIPKQIEVVKLLLSLKEPPHALIVDLLQSRKQFFFVCISKSLQMAKESSLPIMEILHKHFLEKYEMFTVNFKEIFLNTGVNNVIEDNLRYETETMFTNFTKELFSKYFEVVEKSFSEHSNLTNQDSQQVPVRIGNLANLLIDFRKKMEKLSKLCPDAEMSKASQSIIENVEKNCIQSAFVVIYNLFLESIGMLYEKTLEEFGFQPLESTSDDGKGVQILLERLENVSAEELSRVVRKASLEIARHYIRLFANLQPLISPPSGDSKSKAGHSTLIRYLSRQLHSSLEQLAAFFHMGFIVRNSEVETLESIKHVGSLKKKHDAPLTSIEFLRMFLGSWDNVNYTRKGFFLLLLSRVATVLSSEGINKICEGLFELYGIELKQKSISTHRDSFEQCIDVLNRAFVDYHGQRLGNLLEESHVPGFLKMNDKPTGVRPIIRSVVEQLKAVAIEITLFYGGVDLQEVLVRRKSLSDSLFPRIPKRRSLKGMGIDLDRIFSKKVEIFGSIDRNTHSLLFSVIKSMFKSFLEVSRTERLTAMSFQQTQIDIFYLQLGIPEFLTSEERETLNFLLDCIMSSALDRCARADPQMDPYKVEQICRKSLPV